MIEKMRAQVKSKKKSKLAEYSFMVPQFMNAKRIDQRAPA